MIYIIEGEEIYNRVCSYLKNIFLPYERNNYNPSFLGSKMLLHVVFFILVLKIISVGFFLPLPQNFFFADITKIDLLNLLNQNRQDLGLGTLSENNILDQAAYLKAQDMIKNGYFAHQSPQGISPWFWFKQAGYNYKYAGENLAIGFVDSTMVYDAWLNSPSHKENLLNNNYTEVGTAVVSGFEGNTIVVVQLFGNPLPKDIAKSVVPKKVTENKPTVPANNSSAQNIVSEVNSSKPTEITQDSQGSLIVKVLSQSTEYPLLSMSENTVKSTLYYKFLNFIVYDNDKILQYASYGILMLIVICLLMTITINFEAYHFKSTEGGVWQSAKQFDRMKHKDLIFRSLLLIVVLFIATLIDKDTIFQIIPHQVII